MIDKNSFSQIDIEHRGESIQVEQNRIGFEYHGRAASYTGYLSISARDGIPNKTVLISLVQARIEAFLQAPYLIGKYDHNSWREISKNLTTGAPQIRLPHWHTGELLAELERQGFVLVDRPNLFLDAPAHLDQCTLQALVKPLLEPGSRATPEVELAQMMALSAAQQGEAHKQISLF
ncbi:hypothetical protein [Microbulbifer sp. 2205BS26-8]|uniref:hypothetical protein n=1 Tax=Microbulbifer sp. 2205BS26-8 TaxID=3064386 RepID=UPI00273D657E|nr:hypothetical protein [Microbulbifer sp. 2205BS26-8]MDP5209842.1 hypothetical protein [Microbulbifer sp. 2205BS26-8]